MVLEGLAAAENTANHRSSVHDIGQSRNRLSLLYGIEKNYKLVDAVVPDRAQGVTVIDQLLSRGLEPFSYRQLFYFIAAFRLPCPLLSIWKPFRALRIMGGKLWVKKL